MKNSLSVNNLGRREKADVPTAILGLALPDDHFAASYFGKGGCRCASRLKKCSLHIGVHGVERGLGIMRGGVWSLSENRLTETD